MPDTEHGAQRLESLLPIYVLGLGIPQKRNGPVDLLPTHPILEKADAIVGGRAQLSQLAAHPGEKLLVGKDIDGLYQRMAALRADGKLLVALCSGDPLFFGLGARLAERFGPEAIRVLPGISSLQAAAAFLGLPWENLRAVSLHGRSGMLCLARAFLEGNSVFVLCDEGTSPPEIAQWLLERGCDNFTMHVLDNLVLGLEGEPDAEAYVCLAPEEARQWRGFSDQNPGEARPKARQRVLVIRNGKPSANPCAPAGGTSEKAAHPGRLLPGARPFGIEDARFTKENNLLTKLPLRAAGLAALGIEPGSTVWDLGAGSGAVSIEAARLAWQGQVFAVERDEKRLACIHANRARFMALNLEIVEGTLPGCLENIRQDGLPAPDRIFVGGGLGADAAQAARTLELAWEALRPGGRLLAHCVLLSSLELARAVLGRLAESVQVSSLQAAEASPLAGDMQLKALNPVFLVMARKAQRFT